MDIGTNYLGITDQATMDKAIRFAAEFLEMPASECCEFHIQLAWELMEQRLDLAAATKLINGVDPDDETES